MDDAPSALLNEPLRQRIAQAAGEKIIRCMKDE